MKKLKMIISCLLLFFIVSGCNNTEVDTFANISNPNDTLNTGTKVLTAGTVYDYIRENDDSEVSDELLKLLLNSQIDFKNGDLLNLYKEYLNDYFYDTFIKEGKYEYNGEFSEALLVSYLYSENYDINCGEGYTSGDLNKEYFSCDYSDYIEKEVKNDIYLKLLKIQYLIEEKADLIDRKEVRKITYYSVKKSSSSSHETLKELEDVIQSIEENYNSTDGEKIKSLEDYEQQKIKEDIEKLDENHDKLSSASDSSFGYLADFTKCGDVFCSVEDSYNHQYNEILDKKYLVSDEVVTKDDTEILYEGARNLLFSSNLKDYLVSIGNDTYLVSPVSGREGELISKDAILYDVSSSTYYIVRVDEINSKSLYEDQILAAEELLNYVEDATVLDYYFSESNISIYDKTIREYFTSVYGEYKKD